MNRHLTGSRVIAGVVRAWRDAQFAQRRLFEIRTGIRADNRLR